MPRFLYVKQLCVQTPATQEVKSVVMQGHEREIHPKLKANSNSIFVGKSCSNMKWKVQEFVFSSPDQELCQRWVERIKEIIEGDPDRPHRLQVIINPYGGKGKAPSIYETRVAPLFEIAGIKTGVTVTKNADHARALGVSMNLHGVDGVVCVGGDGTFAEFVNGVLVRTQNENGIDPDDPASVPVPPSVRFGVIPAGSTDVIAYDTTGINDPVTSALQIILGFSLGLDVCSVHHNNSLLRYTFSFLGYGFLGDVLKESENYRWMGPARYEFAGVKEYLKHQVYRGEVAFLPSKDEDNSPWDKEGCRIGCGVCSKRRSQKHRESYHTPRKNDFDDIDTTSKWRYVTGQFTAINAALVSGRCSRTVTGMSPAAHLGNGCIDLVLVRQCSRFDYLRHMLRLASSGNHFNFDFVEVHRVKAFKFRSLNNDLEMAVPAESELNDQKKSLEESPRKGRSFRVRSVGSVGSTSSWNIDGEVGEPPDIDVRVHCQLIRVFARGPEPSEAKEMSVPCCFCRIPKADPLDVYTPHHDNEAIVDDD
ncbi:ceramide kinase-like [Diadema antillarum]|uniref:ceramide kinase-like n=1 Tax=Diadema antillarum TaxID=105358 RepID=UPI003A87BEE4